MLQSLQQDNLALTKIKKLKFALTQMNAESYREESCNFICMLMILPATVKIWCCKFNWLHFGKVITLKSVITFIDYIMRKSKDLVHTKSSDCVEGKSRWIGARCGVWRAGLWRLPTGLGVANSLSSFGSDTFCKTNQYPNVFIHIVYITINIQFT